jgi:hypothetical protein
MENWIIIILSSALISAIVSGLTSFIIERRKFSQEYWKIAIEKRLDVYEQIEQVLIFFQTTNLIKERPCHLAFLSVESFSDIQTKLAMLTWKRNWISTNVFNKIIELNRLFYECNSLETDQDVNNFGVKHYNEIAIIRDNILKLTTKDYLQMPDVKRFFKSKIEEKHS